METPLSFSVLQHFNSRVAKRRRRHVTTVPWATFQTTEPSSCRHGQQEAAVRLSGARRPRIPVLVRGTDDVTDSAPRRRGTQRLGRRPLARGH